MFAPAAPRSPRNPVSPRCPRLPHEARRCQLGPGHGPGLSFNATKLEPFSMTTSKRSYVAFASYVPRMVRLRPEGPTMVSPDAARQTQSFAPGVHAVSFVA